MNKAQPGDAIRTTIAAARYFGGRTIPTGTEGIVLAVDTAGTYLMEATLRRADDTGDAEFDLVTLSDCQFGSVPAS